MQSLVLSPTSGLVVAGDEELLIGLPPAFKRLPRPGASQTSEVAPITHLCASPNGDYFAFYIQAFERYAVMDALGEVVYERRFNTDRWGTTGILFSDGGDAVALFGDYDGGHGMDFFSIAKGYREYFGPSTSPIGYDGSLRRFTPAVWVEAGEEETVNLQDRHKRTCERVRIPSDSSRIASFLDRSNELGYYVYPNRVERVPFDQSNPEGTIAITVPEYERPIVRCTGSHMLLWFDRIKQATVVDLGLGSVYTETNVASCCVTTSHIALLKGGSVVLIDASTTRVETPPAGRTLIAIGAYMDNVYWAHAEADQPDGAVAIELLTK